MQMIENPWGVTAYGAASVKAMPDLVRVRFKVVTLEHSPAVAFATASTAIQAVRTALREHSVPDSGVQSSRLNLKTSWNYGGQKKTFEGYQCEAGFMVETAELDQAQPLLVDLVAAGANEIEAVEFDVAGKADLRAEARRRAVTAARLKAELYAQAANVRLGPVLHIDDVDPENTRAERYRSHSSYADAAAEDLAPGHVVVSAAVVLGFGISHE